MRKKLTRDQLTERQKAFLESLEHLRDAMANVSELWSGEVPHDIGGKAYPFEMSFDEYPGAVGAWIEKAEAQMLRGPKEIQ